MKKIRYLCGAALLAAITLSSLQAGPTCPQCYTHSSYVLCLTKVKYDITPSEKWCDSTVKSDFECLSEAWTTTITTKRYTGGADADCEGGGTWTLTDTWVYDVNQCFNDDTMCGGNG
jgi:hypothetical protein